MIETISSKDTMHSGTREQYFANARSAYLSIQRAMFSAGVEKQSIERILDFGCGYGRVMRAIREAHPSSEIVATDLMPDAVAFCADTFDAIPVPGQEDVDTIRYPSKFDLIWVGSVFTHLPERGFRGLLSHLANELAPDGLLVFTTHGRTALWVIEKHRLNRSHMRPEQFFAMKDEFYREGFGFTQYGAGIITHCADQQGATLTTGKYGFSCCRPDWVCRTISEHPELTLVSYQEGGWGNNHDVVTVKRPATQRLV